MGSGIKDAGRIFNAIWDAATVSPRDDDPMLFHRKVNNIGSRVKDYYTANKYYPGTRIAPVKVPMEQNDVAALFGDVTHKNVATIVSPNNTKQSSVPTEQRSFPEYVPSSTRIQSSVKSSIPTNVTTTPRTTPQPTTPSNVKQYAAWSDDDTDAINELAGTNFTTQQRVELGIAMFGKDYRGTDSQNNSLAQQVFRANIPRQSQQRAIPRYEPTYSSIEVEMEDAMFGSDNNAQQSPPQAARGRGRFWFSGNRQPI